MPENPDLLLYRERAAKWREAADALPPGERRNNYLAISESYLRLAELMERRCSGRRLPLLGSPAPSPSAEE